MRSQETDGLLPGPDLASPIASTSASPLKQPASQEPHVRLSLLAKLASADACSFAGIAHRRRRGAHSRTRSCYCEGSQRASLFAVPRQEPAHLSLFLQPIVDALPLPPAVAVTPALPPTASRVTRSASAQTASRSPSPAPVKANGAGEDIESKLAAANQRALDAREHGPSVARRQPARLAATPSKPAVASRQPPSQARSTRLPSIPLASSQPAPASPGPSRGGRASSMRGLSALPDLPSPGQGSPRRSTRNGSTNGRSQLSQQASQPMTWTGNGDEESEESEEEDQVEGKKKGKVGIWG